MTWNKITGQRRTKEILSKAIQEDKVAHAYLFTGNEGVGKDALALEFAKVLNCSNTRVIDGLTEACDKCPNCIQSEKLQHPNINLIFALPTGKSNSGQDLSNDQIDEVRDQTQMKAEDNYYKITVPKANSIRISSIRDIKKNLSMSNSFKAKHCVIVFDSDMMTNESANAFLKTLEEPHENVTLILTSSKQDAILQTILSRCRHIECPALSDEELAETIISKYNMSIADAKIAAAFAQGSLSRAAMFVSDEIKDMRENLLNMLRTALKRSRYRLELEAYIEDITKLKDKNISETFLRLLLIWMRDIAAYVKTQNSDNIVNVDQIDTIKRFADNFSEADVFEAVRVTEVAINKIGKNIQIKLIFLTLFLSIRRIFLTNKT